TDSQTPASSTTPDTDAPTSDSAVSGITPPEQNPAPADTGHIWNAGLWDNATRRAAAQQLFALWERDYPSAPENIAHAAAEAGLSVLERRGSLATLRKLNRPAILVLHDDGGRRRFATLTGLDAAHAVVSFAEHIFRIKSTELVKHWRGDFILLWQPPPDYSTPVYPGHEGEMVTWLDQKLAVIHERPPAGETRPVLGGTLLDELRQFQAANGLTPDGILGPVTLIHLHNATGGTYPRLQSDTHI
ncbi:MAG: peptidoglycan-binding protein, partial [Desulfuromonadaceae bacterium]